MPLIDRMKSQAKQVAGQVAEKAQQAGQAGQAKLDELTARRQLDANLRQLGAIAYALQQGRNVPDQEATTARLVDAIAAFESEHGSIDPS